MLYTLFVYMCTLDARMHGLDAPMPILIFIIFPSYFRVPVLGSLSRRTCRDNVYITLDILSSSRLSSLRNRFFIPSPLPRRHNIFFSLGRYDIAQKLQRNRYRIRARFLSLMNRHRVVDTFENYAVLNFTFFFTLQNNAGLSPVRVNAIYRSISDSLILRF